MSQIVGTMRTTSIYGFLVSALVLSVLLVFGVQLSAGAEIDEVFSDRFEPVPRPLFFLDENGVHLKAADLAQVEGQAFLDAIARFAQPLAIHYRWRPQLNDPADEMVLETAVNGQAEAIVTFNQRHFPGVSGNFGIQTWLPAEALRMMR